MSQLPKRILGAAAAVITAVSAPSTAYARFDRNPLPARPTSPVSSTLCSEVCSADGYETSSNPSPTQPQQSQLQSYQRAIKKSFGPTPGGLEGPVIRVHSASIRSAGATRTSTQDKFHWDDAGIGAAGMLVLLGAGAGSAAVLIRRRADQSRVS